MERFVAAITGSKDPHVVSLARKILQSHQQSNNNVVDNEDSTWRRIQRGLQQSQQSSSPEECEATMVQVQELYNKLQEDNDNNRPDIPPKLMNVLSRFIGQGQRKTKSSSYSPSPSSFSTNTDNRSTNYGHQYHQYHQQQHHHHQQRQTSQQLDTAGLYHHDYTTPLPRALGEEEDPPLPPPHGDAAAEFLEGHEDTSKEEEKEELEQEQEQYADIVEEADESQWMKEEDILMRECLYSLQGMDGERIRFFSRSRGRGRGRGNNIDGGGGDDDSDDGIHGGITYYEGVRVHSPAVSNRLLYSGRVQSTRLGSGAMDALRICGEAGWFYTRIQSYVENVQNDETMGVVARAFAEALSVQLFEYQSLLTTFEAKLPAWSLRQLLVELRQPTQRLRLLAMLTDGLKQYKGGQLLIGLHKHSLNGNTSHAKIVEKILIKASRPWFEILYLWTTQGILADPWNELFISENPDVDDKYLWSDKYRINHGQVPNGVLGKELVGPAFNVGKGINFIRRCLQDAQWTMPKLTDDTVPVVGRDSVHRPFDLDPDTSRNEDDKTNVLGYGYTPKEDMNGDNAALKATLNRSSSLVQSYILQTLKEDNHLMVHLYAMKQFLLLGQGDFFSTLMEGLDEEFGQEPSEDTPYSRGVASINKHALIAIVDAALRNTNAKQLPPFVLERLQVELLLGPDDEQNGPSWGWDNIQDQQGREGGGGGDDGDNERPPDDRTVFDIFSLDYEVPDPLVAIVSDTSLDMYKMIFQILFRLKRIEYLLNFTWRQSASLSHSIQLFAQYTGIDSSTNQGFKEAMFLLRKIAILRQSMMHLIVNLKSYLQFEVVEGGWYRLVAAIDDATTLDRIIESHHTYLTDIFRKAMVRGSSQNDPIQQKLIEQLESALMITSQFCLLQNSVFADALDAADRASEKRRHAASRLRDGQWGFDSEKEVEEQDRFFGLGDPILMEEVNRMTLEFNESTLELIQALNDKVNGSGAVPPEEHRTGTRSGRINQLVGEEEETGPQRFLIAQLDNNQYYTRHVPVGR